MSYFPFMIDIKDKDCLVAGGGQTAKRKVMELLQFGAHVTVIAPDVCRELKTVREIDIAEKEYEKKDIDGRFLVVAATDNGELNRRISADCNERQILVNAVDIRDACSFIFPAIIKRDELVVSISTGGNSPAGAAYLKEKLRQGIPDNYEKNLEILGHYRSEIMEMITEPSLRKKVYYSLLETADKENRILNSKDIRSYIEKYSGM